MQPNVIHIFHVRSDIRHGTSNEEGVPFLLSHVGWGDMFMSRQPGHVTFVSRRPRGSYTTCHVDRRGRISRVTSIEGAYTFLVTSTERYLTFTCHVDREETTYLPSTEGAYISRHVNLGWRTYLSCRGGPWGQHRRDYPPCHGQPCPPRSTSAAPQAPSTRPGQCPRPSAPATADSGGRVNTM